jgi:hypothetical protein
MGNKLKNMKICRVCNKEFEAYRKPKKSGRRSTMNKRPFKALTCSSKCSRMNPRGVPREVSSK